MKTYPTISKDINTSVSVIVFDKLDGSNVRAEWSAKKGFHKFGRRNGLLDHSNPTLLEAPEIIQSIYEENIFNILKKKRIEKATLYFEFWGENSFAGNHENEPHTVTLFDIHVYRKGFMLATDLLKDFQEHVPLPKVLHQGTINQQLLESVRQGNLEGMTFEGVVCKGPLNRKKGLPWMFKIKNQAWLDKLRSICRTEEEFLKRS